MPDIQHNTLLALIHEEITQLSLELEQNTQCSTFAQELRQAHRYPLLAGGKRVRPLLLLLLAGSVGGSKAIEIARKSALAVELIHTYSLVHDDLPCMDNDDLRRGAPTTHKVYGEAKALLVGDGLLTQAFSALSSTAINNPSKKYYISFLVETLAACAGAEGMIWGQWLDLSFTGNTNVTWEVIELMHRNKTGKLIGACLEMGLICGMAALETEITDEAIKVLRKNVREAGILIGLSFQIIDDILDGTQNSRELGKTAQKDEQQNKITALSLLGQKKAEELSQHYTEKALSLIKEILSDKVINESKVTDKDFFQKNLYLQIQILLTRTR